MRVERKEKKEKKEKKKEKGYYDTLNDHDEGDGVEDLGVIGERAVDSGTRGPEV